MSQSRGPLGEPWHAWLALLVGVLAVSAHSASSLAYSVLMKPLLANFSWERTDFAAAVNVRLLVMTAVIPFAGLLTDRIGARAVLALGALVIGVGNLSISAIDSQAGLYMAMAFMGPGQAGLGSVAASALVLRLFRRRTGLAIGILNGGDNLINSTVPLAAAALLVAWGWRWTVLYLGCAYLGMAVLFFSVLRGAAAPASEMHDTEPSRARLRDLPWADTRLWLVFLAYFCIYAFITSVQLHFHAYQTDLGRSPADASRLLSIQILVGAIGAPLVGLLAERRSAATALLVVVAGLATTSVMVWSAEGFWVFVLWAVAYGLVNSGVVAVLPLVLVELFGPAAIGRLMGVAMVFCMTATMLGNFATAAVFDYLGSYVRVWQIYTALMVLTLVPVYRLLASAAGSVHPNRRTGKA
jgi:MFS family permease